MVAKRWSLYRFQNRFDIEFKHAHFCDLVHYVLFYQFHISGIQKRRFLIGARLIVIGLLAVIFSFLKSVFFLLKLRTLPDSTVWHLTAVERGIGEHTILRRFYDTTQFVANDDVYLCIIILFFVFLRPTTYG